MIEVLILPGLDGTATLHEEIHRELKALGIASRSISYPVDQGLDYAQLVEFVRPLLPVGHRYALLGESFSGPVAIAIAASQPPQLAALLLSTTYARSPVAFLGWLSGLARFAPARLPSALLSWWLLGPWSKPPLLRRIQAALASVRPEVARGRAATAMRCDVSGLLPAITAPTLLLRARRDRLLAPGAQSNLADGLPAASKVEIAGPHLLLQTHPRECAKAIAGFLSALEGGK